jgi:hypothetical protein
MIRLSTDLITFHYHLQFESRGVQLPKKYRMLSFLDLRAWELTPPTHIRQLHDPIINKLPGLIDCCQKQCVSPS